MKYLLIIAIAVIGLFSCATTSNKTTTPGDDQSIMWVNSTKVDCMGIGPMECLLVQENESLAEDNWTFFYSQIQGFTFEPGYIYKLLVHKEQLDPSLVPADASSIKYTLVQELVKKSDQRLQLNDIWALEYMQGLEGEIAAAFSKQPVLELHLNEMRFAGNDGCNQIMGTIHTIDSNILKLGPGMSTMMACPNMDNNHKYTSLLESVKTYKLEGLILSLLDENSNEVLRYKKVD